ncbi:alpha-xylosidase [Clostridium lacusfryxellense]|uniref:alpha-xylosidase n=1 Tax=Clostridium lacusfryxellense TaxID=205328 RepID=UPI001C0CBEDE|nr:alpha-xylosidase [Clostridium lacusfryxellense]MBU3112207.1 alpha-xylosidase [Clostridium lacusfryxellense]
MKFSNGCWLNKEGIDTYSPAQVYNVINDDKSISTLATTRVINHRGDTLGGPVLTVKLSSPMEDVIRVQIFHFKGLNKKSPEFKIEIDEDEKVNIINNDDFTSLKTGNLSVKIPKAGDWSIDFYNGVEKLTSSGNRNSAYIQTKDDGNFMRDQLNLSVGELVYGLGEHFTPFIKNGQTVDMWNEDGGTSTDQSYKNIPFYVTNKGYGVFVNHPECVSFEVGSEKVTSVQFSVPGEYLEYFVINGPTLKEVLQKYTSLTGKPALPPAWTFGLWLTTSFTTNYDEKTVTGFVDGMAERDLPLHVFHFDCFWMKDFQWCNFEWDSRVFPDPVNMLKRLKEKGLKICVWINPYIAQESKLFDEGMKNGYLIKKSDGDVWQWDMWQPGMAIVDFTNPDASTWYASKLHALVDMGVDCFKTDFGERIPTQDIKYFNGADPIKMHNYYTLLYNEVVFNVLKDRFGEGKAALFARSATVGGQKFPVHWGGDCSADYESMSESLRGGLSLCMSGFGFWSHDIGGFESTSSADVYKRWAAFGLLSSHSRLHGSTSYRVPWVYDDEACDVVRFFTKLKCSLMPYIFKNACETAQSGIPVMRAMILDFQEDPTCAFLDRQYMLGDSLLVAPIFNEKGNASYYLPIGNWTNFITNETIIGGSWRKETHNYMSLPLLVKPNSIIAIGSENRKPDYDYVDDALLHVFELENNVPTSTTIYNIDGKPELNVSIIKNKNDINIKSSGSDKSWSILLRGLFNIEATIAATTAVHILGTILIIDKNAKEIICKIK